MTEVMEVELSAAERIFLMRGCLSHPAFLGILFTWTAQ